MSNSQVESFVDGGRISKRKGERSAVKFYADFDQGTYTVATGPTGDDSTAQEPIVSVYDNTNPPPGNLLSDFANQPFSFLNPAVGDQFIGSWMFNTADSQIIQGTWVRIWATVWLISSVDGLTHRRIFDVKCDIL